MTSQDSATSGAGQSPIQNKEKSHGKSGPPRTLEIDLENPFLMDPERIYATMNALRRHDIQDCTTKDLDHTAELLERLVVLHELCAEPVGTMLDRLIALRNGERMLKEFMKRHYERSVSLGAAQEFTAALVAARTEGGKDLDIALVQLEKKWQGCSEQTAIRAVAQHLVSHEMTTDPEAVERKYEAFKKKIQRSKKKKS